MNRQQLEHVIRAAAAIAEVDELIIIGSQAILASVPDAPEDLLTSWEVDLYPSKEPEKAILIDGSIGEGSLFDEQFKCYAHGVGPETAVLPPDWQDRLIPLQTPATGEIRALCLHPVDIAVSKLVAGRHKDLAYIRVLFANSIVGPDQVEEAIAGLPANKRTVALDNLQYSVRTQ